MNDIIDPIILCLLNTVILYSFYITIIIMSAQKIYKFAFIAHIQTVTLALKFPCVVSITWRRGQKISEVKQRRQIVGGVVTFNQPLELECNMTFDVGTKKFQEKKTKFTILIFSEKGNKQAGQINFDVSPFLNAKQKQLKVQQLLEKCPDKNAKLSFVLTTYLKEEMQKDQISQKSQNTITPEYNSITPSVILQPDFKKKKPEQPPLPNKQQKKEPILDQQNQQQRIPTVNKANKQRLKLEEENRKLKQQLAQLRELQIENATLKKRYEQAERKSQSYYTKKLEQVKKQLAENKMKAKAVQQLNKKKFDLQKQMCDCKQQMGRILNYAITSGNNEMAEQIYNIYQNVKPMA